MNWILKIILSSIGKKLLMALTGIFLIFFLLVHVSGNLLLLKGDSGQAFNIYANFMTKNPLIIVVSYVNYFFILLHITYAYYITQQNQNARPINYLFIDNSVNSSWSSRNMGILGTILFIFLIIHLKGFWYEYKFGSPPNVFYHEVGEIKDMYSVVVNAYTQWWYSAFYVISMLFIALHLWHGFKSLFQTLGLYHSKYTLLIEKLGIIYSLVIPILFAIIPIWIYFNI